MKVNDIVHLPSPLLSSEIHTFLFIPCKTPAIRILSNYLSVLSFAWLLFFACVRAVSLSVYHPLVPSLRPSFPLIPILFTHSLSFALSRSPNSRYLPVPQILPPPLTLIHFFPLFVSYSYITMIILPLS